MTPAENVQVPQESEKYETPEIVSVGPAILLTSGMGGTSKDMEGWTIPVTPRQTTEIELAE